MHSKFTILSAWAVLPWSLGRRLSFPFLSISTWSLWRWSFAIRSGFFWKLSFLEGFLRFFSLVGRCRRGRFLLCLWTFVWICFWSWQRQGLKLLFWKNLHIRLWILRWLLQCFFHFFRLLVFVDFRSPRELWILACLFHWREAWKKYIQCPDHEELLHKLWGRVLLLAFLHKFMCLSFYSLLRVGFPIHSSLPFRLNTLEALESRSRSSPTHKIFYRTFHIFKSPELVNQTSFCCLLNQFYWGLMLSWNSGSLYVFPVFGLTL